METETRDELTRRLEPAARIFAAYLAKYGRGAGRAIPKRTMLPLLGQAGLRITGRDFDRLPGVCLELGLDIGTSGKGSFWMATPEDFDAASANLRSRFQPMRRHDGLLAARRRDRFPDEPLLQIADCGLRIAD